jgi:dihydropteroate synthase
VVTEVAEYLIRRRDRLVADGIDLARLCLDPGIGFGKTHAHNLQLLRACGQFRRLGCPLLVGPSRKGFIAHVLGDKQVDRAAGTVGVVLALAAQGVPVIRVHDVAAARQALLLFEAAGGLGGMGE